MPNNINTSFLAKHILDTNGDSSETMVKVDHVSMVFNMASEQLNSLKEYVIALARRELRFKEFRALDDVSLEVKKGDVFGILGTNGSGKSTLLKIIAGVLEPTEGTCEINGNIAPLIELGAGFDMELTARENIYLNGALLGYPKRFIEQNFDDIVEFAEIENFLDMPLKNYSSGMVARIAFAIATVIVPEILIVDEVLSVGDFMFQQKCEKRIMKLIKEYDVTVLIVSHNNDQIERLCNKAIWIEKGHTRMAGTAQEVCDTYRILGGRIGSRESEQHVFKVLQSSIAAPEDNIDTIAGEDRYGTAAKLAERCHDAPCQIIMIASGDSAPHCMIATSLSGALNAPLLLTKNHALPDVTRQTIKHYQPKKIIILGNESAVSTDIFKEIVSLENNKIQIERITGADPSELSLSAYHYGITHDIQWGDTAVLINNDNDNGNLISISPLLYMDNVPIFFRTNQQGKNDEIAKAIDHGCFKRLVSFEEKTIFSEENFKNLNDKGTEIISFREDGPYNTNEQVNNWLETQRFSQGSIDISTLIIASVWNPFDALAAGVYAGKSHSAFLLEDPQDIDSVSHALDYIEKKDGAIKQLVFLGDKTNYNALDKKLLGKALAKQWTKTNMQADESM